MSKIVDKEAKKEQIMQAAYELFIEKGYKTVTTREIAKNAGVSKGILYDYFKNKEDLFYQTVKEKMVKNLALMAALQDENMTSKEIMDKFFDMASCYNPLREKRFLMMFDFVLHCPDKNLMQEIIGNLFEMYREYVREIFRRTYPKIFNDKDRSVIYTNMLIAFVDGIHMQFLTNPEKTRLEETFNLFWNNYNKLLMEESAKIDVIEVS